MKAAKQNAYAAFSCLALTAWWYAGTPRRHMPQNVERPNSKSEPVGKFRTTVLENQLNGGLQQCMLQAITASINVHVCVRMLGFVA